MASGTREDHGLILTGAAEHIVPATLGESLYQHFYHTSYLALIRSQREFLLQGDDLIQTAHFLLLRDIIRQVFLRIRTGPLRVLEHKGRVKFHLTHQAERLLMILQRLAVEAAEHIRTDRSVRQNATNSGDTIQVPLARIFTIHGLQHRIASRLHRQVDKAADIPVGCYCLQRTI